MSRLAARIHHLCGEHRLQRDHTRTEIRIVLEALLVELDDRQRNGGDYKALAYLEQKEKDKADVVRELMIFRRDENQNKMKGN